MWARVCSPLCFALLLSCGGEGTPSTLATPCPLPPRVSSDALPSDIDLEQYGVLTEARQTRGFLQARVVSEIKIVELYPPIARSLLDNRYEILSGDNEGFEAEIFFRRGKQVSGNVYMREGPCQGQVTLTLVYGSVRKETG